MQASDDEVYFPPEPTPDLDDAPLTDEQIAAILDADLNEDAGGWTDEQIEAFEAEWRRTAA